MILLKQLRIFFVVAHDGLMIFRIGVKESIELEDVFEDSKLSYEALMYTSISILTQQGNVSPKG